MQLRNHVAYRFLTDQSFIHEMLETVYPEAYERFTKNIESDEDYNTVGSLFQIISPAEQTAYYVTDTVLEKLDMLKVSKQNGTYDWTVFKNIQERKITFIFKNNFLLRLLVSKDTLFFTHIEYVYYSAADKIKNKSLGTAHWINFWINRVTGEQCDYYGSVEVKKIEKFVYHLLCFFFLSENTEIVVSPGKSYGTRKQADALSNDCNVPVTIVNSNWAVTSIRTTGFDVRGHFRLQPHGPQNSETKMIFINPFKKNGYVRKASKPESAS